MKECWNFIFKFFFRWWVHHQKRDGIQLLKVRGLIFYLKALNGARFSAIGIVALLISLQLLTLGFILMAGAFVFLSSWDLRTQLWMIFAMGAILFVVPVLGLSYLLSERLWYRGSGAQRLVEKTLQQ